MTGAQRSSVTSGLTLSPRQPENRTLKLERDILSKAAAWFAREARAIPSKDSVS